MSTTTKREVRLPSFFEAIIPILVMFGLMVYVFAFSHEEYDAAHMPLVVALIVTCIIGFICGHTFQDMLEGIMNRINATLEAILILLTVGLLVSSFMMSGTIPTVIYYGLDLLSPQFLSLIHIYSFRREHHGIRIFFTIRFSMRT